MFAQASHLDLQVWFQAALRECQAMRSYINEGALKPKSIPSQIPNFSVAEFEGWDFSAQKETNTLSPKTKADDVSKSLFMVPRHGLRPRSSSILTTGSQISSLVTSPTFQLGLKLAIVEHPEF